MSDQVTGRKLPLVEVTVDGETVRVPEGCLLYTSDAADE